MVILRYSRKPPPVSLTLTDPMNRTALSELGYDNDVTQMDDIMRVCAFQGEAEMMKAMIAHECVSALFFYVT